MAHLRKFKLPLLVALLFTLVVILADKEVLKFGLPILLLVYFVMMAKMLYDVVHRGKCDGKG